MTMLKPKPGILDIQPYKAGKSQAAEGVTKVIKLSSNENPFGPSPKALEAYKQAVASLYRYPDGSHQTLREAIGRVYSLDAERIVCGAGSDELISLIIQAFVQPGDEVLYSQHGFLMYKLYALAHGAVPVTAQERDCTADVDALLASVTERTKILFIANPNNPTGTYLSKSELHRLHKGLPERVLLVIDDAYAEYVEAEDYSTGQELVEQSENTVMLRTFSKIYGLAALRLGWAYVPASVADVLSRIRSPFNVNAPALAAGVAAIEDTGYLDKLRRINTQERQRVSDALSKHFRIYPSLGNFLMINFGSSEHAAAANQYLLKQGVIIREIAAYGLPHCLRASIGKPDENDALIAGLTEFAGQ